MSTDLQVRPPIPAQCAQRPLVGGVVMPYVNVRLADGGVDFRAQHSTRARECWEQRRCQLCGEPIDGVMVLIGGPADLESRAFAEPPLHPVCAAYATKACPMLAGRMTHFASGPSVSERARGKTCFEPGCDCGGWVPSPGSMRTEAGGPAHPWFVVWVDDFALAHRPDGTFYGGALTGEPRKIRRI